jgi:hypothetical protein
MKYYEKFEIVNQTQEIQSDSNSLTIVNTGTATAVLNGLEIAVGDQYVILGNEGEVNVSKYRLSFIGGGTEQVILIRKIYL